MGWIIDNWLVIIVTIFVLWVILRIVNYFKDKARYKAWLEERHKRLEEKRKRLIDEYGENIADMIMDGEIWQGQTTVQLIDSWGEPADKDIKVLKTKSKEIWKYDEIGKNRYRKIVTLENGLVVGWEMK